MFKNALVYNVCVDSISNTTHIHHTHTSPRGVYVVATALPFLPSPRKKIGCCYTQPSTHTYNGYTLTATTTNYYFNTHHNITTHTPSSQHLIDAMMKSFSYSPLHTHTHTTDTLTRNSSTHNNIIIIIHPESSSLM